MVPRHEHGRDGLAGLGASAGRVYCGYSSRPARTTPRRSTPRRSPRAAAGGRRRSPRAPRARRPSGRSRRSTARGRPARGPARRRPRSADTGRRGGASAARSWATRLPERLARRIHQDHDGVRAPERLERRRDDVRPEDHARAPAVRVVVDRPVLARGPTAAGRGPGPSARPCSRIRPGMLSRSGASTIAGNSVRTSTSRVIGRVVGGGSAGRDGRPGGSAVRRRLGLGFGLPAGSGSSAGGRGAGLVVLDRARVELERLEVHDQLAPFGASSVDDPAARPGCRARRAARARRRPRRPPRGRCRRPCPAPRPRSSARRSPRLVQEPGPGSRGSSGSVDLEVAVLAASRRVPVGHLAEPQPPALPSATGDASATVSGRRPTLPDRATRPRRSGPPGRP